jgi:putative transposase
VAAAHARVANLRTDRLHKLTTHLVHTHTVLGVETLAVKNMMASGGRRKRGLNRSLADASLGHLLRLIDYKAGWYGSTVVKADRRHPSSKTCSGCGAVKTKLRLAERQYTCTECGLVIDRDLNAAINLAKLARHQRTRVPGSPRAEPTIRRATSLRANRRWWQRNPNPTQRRQRRR